jgi:hypothetical protein
MDGVEPGSEGDQKASGAWSGSPRIVIAVLSLAALVGIGCLLMLPAKTSLATVVARGLAYVGATGAAGAAAMWMGWALLRVESAPAPVAFGQAAAEGFVFLPCIVLLAFKDSAWVLLAVGVGLAVMLRGMRYVFPPDEEAGEMGWEEARDFSALYGLPARGQPVWKMAVVAICVQASVIAVFAGDVSTASLFLMVWWSMVLWRFSELRGTRKQVAPVRWPRWRRLAEMGAFALVVTVFLLLPDRPGKKGDSLHAGMKRPAGDRQGDSGSTGEGYVGIVLWPPVAKKKVEVVAPRPHAAMFVAGRSRPIEIPFDGAYWYFKAPDRRPSPKAHVAHGLPAELNIRSSDRSPLLMEAHQRLGTRIDLDCCGQIDLAVTNGDNRLGKIAVGMILTDSSSPARASVYLGEKALVSSEATQIGLTRAPVEETVRFAIPNVKAGRARSFDEITVFFMPDRVRALAGAKVNVRSFKLVPR